MKKGSNIDMEIRAAKILNNLEIELHASMIVGCANQCKSDIISNTKFLKEVIQPTIATFNTIELRPGTDIYNNPKKYGFFMDNSYWYEDPLCAEKIHAKTKYLNEQEIRDVCFECYTIFYG